MNTTSKLAKKKSAFGAAPDPTIFFLEPTPVLNGIHLKKIENCIRNFGNVHITTNKRSILTVKKTNFNNLQPES